MRTLSIFLTLIVGLTFSMSSCKSQSDEVTEEYRSYFTQSDFEQISYLKSLISENVTTDFEEKYNSWTETWSRFRGQSFIQAYTKSEEYDNLLSYCLSFGKALYPLVFDIISQREQLISFNLLIDMTDGGYDYLPSSLPYISLDTYAVQYTNKLLDKEYDNILKSIQNTFGNDNEKQQL